MCIAILNLNGSISKRQIQNSWANNNHGAGFAYSDGSKMVVYKTDKSANEFYKNYRKHRLENSDVPFLLHFRISTHGLINEDNLHPFVINDKVALIHNGMVDFKGHTHSDPRSDTRFMCEEVLSLLPDGWHLSPGVHQLMMEVGGWSKFVMLDLDHKYAIVNESAGHWFEGNWYSNTSYKGVNDYIDYGGKKMPKSSTYSSGQWDDEYSNSYYGTNSYGTKKFFSKAEAIEFNTLVEVERLMHANMHFDYSKTAAGAVRGLYGYRTPVDENLISAVNSFVSLDQNSWVEENLWYSAAGTAANAKEAWQAMVIYTAKGSFTVFAKGGKASTSNFYLCNAAFYDKYLLHAVLATLDAEKHSSSSAQSFPTSNELATTITKSASHYIATFLKTQATV